MTVYVSGTSKRNLSLILLSLVDCFGLSLSYCTGVGMRSCQWIGKEMSRVSHTHSDAPGGSRSDDVANKIFCCDF